MRRRRLTKELFWYWDERIGYILDRLPLMPISRSTRAHTCRLTCVRIHIPAKIGSVAKVEIAASLHPSRPLPPSVNVIIVAATVRNIDEYCTNRSRLMPRASKYMKTKGPGSAASPPASPPTRPATGPAIGCTFVDTDKRGDNS